MRNKILLVGGGGFVGRHVYQCLKNTRYAPIITSRSCLSGFDSIQLDYPDLIKEEDLLSETCCIIILAWSLSVKDKQSMSGYFQDNLIKSMFFIEEMSEKHPEIKYIFVSTGGAIYGENPDLFQSEHSCERPISPYGISKLAMESCFAYYSKLYNFDYFIARPGNPYGEGQLPNSSQGVIAAFLDRIKNNQPIEIWGDGSATKDYLHVEDLAKGITKMIDYTGGSGKVFNLGSGVGVSVNQLIDLIKEVTQKDINVNYLSSKTTDITKVILDSKLARKELGWRVEISLNEGVNRTWNWINSL